MVTTEFTEDTEGDDRALDDQVEPIATVDANAAVHHGEGGLPDDRQASIDELEGEARLVRGLQQARAQCPMDGDCGAEDLLGDVDSPPVHRELLLAGCSCIYRADRASTAHSSRSFPLRVLCDLWGGLPRVGTCAGAEAVYFVLDVVEGLDLAAIEQVYQDKDHRGERRPCSMMSYDSASGQPGT